MFSSYRGFLTYTMYHHRETIKITVMNQKRALNSLTVRKKKIILGECILISSLSGKASRTLVDIARLAEQFNVRFRSRV